MERSYQKKDGQYYAPKGKAHDVCGGKTFRVAALGLDHGHIMGMCNGLSEAGAVISFVFDPDGEKVAAFLKAFPTAKPKDSVEDVLKDDSIALVAIASIPCDRAALAVRAMRAGKHVFVDKPCCTTMEQWEMLQKAVGETGRCFRVYFSERLHVESAVYAEQLIQNGAIGTVLSVQILAPHRKASGTRPKWFFEKEMYGGILTDIGSHQIEQILAFTGARHAKLSFSHVANYADGEHPEFEDFGDASFVCDGGATGYFRVDWFTPDSLPVWGDGRTFILGTKGYMELRKYFDYEEGQSDVVCWANDKGFHREHVHGKTGYPFFGRFIRDCIDGTEESMGQDYVFEVMRLALEAEEKAEVVFKGGDKQ